MFFKSARINCLDRQSGNVSSLHKRFKTQCELLTGVSARQITVKVLQLSGAIWCKCNETMIKLF